MALRVLRTIRLILTPLALTLAVSSGESAEPVALHQETPTLESLEDGSRIRFVAPPRFPDRVRATVTDVTPEQLGFDRQRSRGGPGVVPISDLKRLEVSLEWHRQTVKGLGIGTLVGLGIGGLATWAFCDGADTVCDFGEGVTVTLIVAAPFAALGGLFGYLSREDVWAEVNY